MGRNKKVVFVDDVDGTDASETVEFGLDGVRYEIDLSEANAEALRRTLQRWAKCGRYADERSRRVARARPWHGRVSAPERATIREWGIANGFRVGRRGPLPVEAVHAFREANR
jgi:Lsr2